jgi:hypothetical protein
MFCPKCASQVETTTEYCPNCGAKVDPEAYTKKSDRQRETEYPSNKRHDIDTFPRDIPSMALNIVTGYIFNIVGLFVALFYFFFTAYYRKPSSIIKCVGISLIAVVLIGALWFFGILAGIISGFSGAGLVIALIFGGLSIGIFGLGLYWSYRVTVSDIHKAEAAIRAEGFKV